MYEHRNRQKTSNCATVKALNHTTLYHAVLQLYISNMCYVPPEITKLGLRNINTCTPLKRLGHESTDEFRQFEEDSHSVYIFCKMHQ